MHRLSRGPRFVAFVLTFSLAGLSLHAEEYSGEPYEIHWRDAQVSAALHLIATESGLNLVMAPMPGLHITGDFSDPWDAVVATILEKYGLTYRIADTFFIVGRRGEPLMDPKLEPIQWPATEEPISLNVSNARLEDVVRVLVVNTLAPSKLDPQGQPLRGSITVQAAAVSPRKLLQLMLAANGYGFEEKGGLIRFPALPGFDRPATSEETVSPLSDDISRMIVRGTLTPKKSGSSGLALLEAGGRYREVREGTKIGDSDVIEVKPDHIVIAEERGGARSDVTLRIGDGHRDVVPSVSPHEAGRNIPKGGAVRIPANAGVVIGTGAAPPSGSPVESTDWFHTVKTGCEAGDSQDCSFLAGYYQKGVTLSDGSSVPKDEPRAAMLYKKACDSGYVFSCGELGSLYENGTGVPKDHATALALYKQGCDRGDSIECLRLGTYYAAGAGVPQDFARSHAYYQQACDGKDPRDAAMGCYALGLQFERGLVARKDPARAAISYQKACDMGSADSCFELGLLYEKGSGVPQDRAHAAALFARACDSGSKEACQKIKKTPTPRSNP
jgi:TPR repeat protein